MIPGLMKTKSKLSPADEQIRAIKDAKRRRRRALAMKDAGKTFQEIGNRLGVTRQRAKFLIDKARKEIGITLRRRSSGIPVVSDFRVRKEQ